MIAALLLLIAAAPPAAPASPPAMPREESIELARALNPDVFADLTVERMEQDVTDYLLNPFSAPGRQPCDPAVPACSEAARALAREVAPARLPMVRELMYRFDAIRYERVMSRREIAETLAFLKSASGKSLAKALHSGPTIFDPEYHQIMAALEAADPDPMIVAAARFHEATRDLPRKPSPLVPPPISSAPPEPPSGQ
jgi:hypothetical protein